MTLNVLNVEGKKFYFEFLNFFYVLKILIIGFEKVI